MARASSIVRVLPLALACCAGLATSNVQAQAIDPGFTHQGELSDGGTPANGNFDFRFRLYNASVGGVQQGAQLTQTLAVTNGKFTTTPLNFGAAAFDGTKRWLEIDVRPSGGGGYTTLAPRQELTSAPHAWYAANSGTAATASNALNLGGQGSSFYTNASNLSSGTLPSGRLGGAYSGVLTFSNVGNTYFGNGANLTGLNASNISTGTLSDSLLSANVALRNATNTFSAVNTFTANTKMGAAGAPSANLQIERTTLGGFALQIDGNGGTTLSVNNIVTTAGVLAYGGTFTVEGLSTRYGVRAFLNGTTGLGYSFYTTNETPGGRGLYASMTGTGATYGAYIVNNSTSGYGGYFNNTATSGTTYGLYCENNSPDGYGLYALNDTTTGVAPTIYARNNSTTANAFAVHGVMNSTAPGGFSTGVRGQNNGTSGSGIGVWGSHAGGGWGGYFTSATGYGVYATSGSAVTAIYGYNSGTGNGVRGYSVDGYGGYFDTGVSGGAALYVVGTASVGVLTIRGGADLAENFEFKDTAQTIEPGMVVMIDDEHEGGMEIAAGAYNRRVAGIVSGANELSAGMVLGQFEGQENAKPIALSGRVWTFVDATLAAVEPGDLLTTSDTPGYAMPVVDHDRAHGATIGKAMSRLSKGEKGMVLVLVNLQ